MTVQIVPIPGIPEVSAGDDLARVIAGALRRSNLALEDGDVVAVTQKVVSKSEGRVVAEGPDGKAGWVRRESRRVVGIRGDVIVAETRHGFVCANAGVDASNVAEGFLSLLPEDPDASADRIRGGLMDETGADVAVVITDTFGRPWRTGVVNVAVGCAGLPSLVDLRGTKDALGRLLEVTVVALADEAAAASGLVMGKADGVPAAILRGVRLEGPVAPATALVRPPEEDMFRSSPLQAIREPLETVGLAAADVPREVVAHAVDAAAPLDAVTLVVLDSEPGRRVLSESAVGRSDRTLLRGARILILAVAEAGDHPSISGRDFALARAGAAVSRVRLALSAQGVASAWVPPANFDEPAVRSRFALGEGAFLGVVAAGWPPAGP